MGRSRRPEGDVDLPASPEPATHVVVEVCRCGCTPQPQEPEWPLATAWSWLTRPGDADAGGQAAEPVDPAALPWWDARSRPGKRRTVLPLVLLGELQAGVLLRAVWEVVQGGGTLSA